MSDIVTRTLEFLSWRKREYQATFPKAGIAQNVVLQDMAVFCHINEDEVPTDPALLMAYRAGQRSVWLRFQRHLNLSPSALFDIYSGVRAPSPRENRNE